MRNPFGLKLNLERLMLGGKFCSRIYAAVKRNGKLSDLTFR